MKANNKWGENQKKAESMTDKFIDVLQKQDCYDSWESILIDRIVSRLHKDSGLSRKANLEAIIDTLQTNFGFTVLNVESLAEQIKVEEFVEKLKSNPY